MPEPPVPSPYRTAAIAPTWPDAWPQWQRHGADAKLSTCGRWLLRRERLPGGGGERYFGYAHLNEAQTALLFIARDPKAANERLREIIREGIPAGLVLLQRAGRRKPSEPAASGGQT